MTTRERFLRTLREQVTQPVTPPRVPVVAIDDVPPSIAYSNREGGALAFLASVRALSATAELVSGLDGARRCVVERIAGRSPVLIGADQLVAPLSDLATLRWPECGIASAATAAVAVVGAVAGVAQTGSVVVDARSAQGRAVSLLAPACIFLVRAGDIVDTPGDVLRNRARWWPGGVPSQVVLITGPSRSADIEMTLARGVHGPGEIHVVVVGSGA